MQKDNQTLGISCILIGMIIMPLMDAIIKILSDSYPLHEVVMVRSGVAILLTLVIVHFEGGLGLLVTKRPWLHLARGLLIAIANMAYYLALASMPLGLVTAIFFISPLLITALSVPLLGEHVGWRRWLAVVAGFIGVVIMMGVGADNAFDLSALLPIVAAFGYALTQIITRKLGTTDKASVMSFYISFTFLFISFGFWVVVGDGSFAGQGGAGTEFLLRAWRMPDAKDLSLMIAIGVIVTIVGYLFSQAYRVAEANVVAPFEYVALPVAIMWGYVFWGDVPNLQTMLGIVLVVGSGFYVFLREKRATGPVNQNYGIGAEKNRQK